MMEPIVIIPTLDEAEAIGSVIRKVAEAHSECHVLVVDGGSTDGTIEIVRDLQSEWPQVEIIRQSTERRGFGEALALGFQRALAGSFDPIITMDGDESHDPGYISDFLESADEHDLVIGSRYTNVVRVEGWKFRKLLLSKLANMYVSYVMVKPIWDFTSGFRCYRRHLLEKVDLGELQSQAYAVQIQLVHFAFRYRFTVKEIPFIYRDNKPGASKVGRYPKWRTFLHVLKYRAPFLEMVRHSTYLRKDYQRFVEEYDELVNPPRLKRGGRFEVKRDYEISVGVMAHNEEELIRPCIDKLLGQNVSGGTIREIIVVSSGSTDDTDAIVREISSRDHRVRLITQDKRMGKASAINEYLAEAQGDILVLESADTYTESNTLTELIKPFLDESTGVVGAHPIPVNDEGSLIGYCVHKLWKLHHSLAQDNPKCGEMIAFRNLIMRIPQYTAVDEAAIESMFAHHGFKLVYAPGAVVYNKGPEHLRDFMKQRRRIAAGHRHLRASTGHEVATQSSGKILRHLLKDQSLHPKCLMYTAILICIEGVSRFMGSVDYYLRDKNPFIWDIARTTKRM